MHIKEQNLANALEKGLGRTFEYIKQKKAEELRPDLLNACLHNLVYDRQCEASRAEWLLELINLTDDVEYYRQNILQALPDTNDDWDIQQLYELAAIWAKKGDREAKQIIYDAFKKQEFEERAFNHAVGCDLIDLAQTQKSLELVNCLLWVYEHTPCTVCRREAVEILIEFKQMPEALLKECLHDCSSEIRNLAAKNA